MTNLCHRCQAAITPEMERIGRCPDCGTVLEGATSGAPPLQQHRKARTRRSPQRRPMASTTGRIFSVVAGAAIALVTVYVLLSQIRLQERRRARRDLDQAQRAARDTSSSRATRPIVPTAPPQPRPAQQEANVPLAAEEIAVDPESGDDVHVDDDTEEFELDEFTADDDPPPLLNRIKLATSPTRLHVKDVALLGGASSTAHSRFPEFSALVFEVHTIVDREHVLVKVAAVSQSDFEYCWISGFDASHLSVGDRIELSQRCSFLGRVPDELLAKLPDDHPSVLDNGGMWWFLVLDANGVERWRGSDGGVRVSFSGIYLERTRKAVTMLVLAPSGRFEERLLPLRKFTYESRIRILSHPLPPSPVRKWTDHTGKHQILASYDGEPTKNGKIKLLTMEGETIDVAPRNLSIQDREWIRSYISYLNEEPEDERRALQIKQYRAALSRQRRANRRLRQAASFANAAASVRAFKARSILPGTK